MSNEMCGSEVLELSDSDLEQVNGGFLPLIGLAIAVAAGGLGFIAGYEVGGSHERSHEPYHGVKA